MKFDEAIINLMHVRCNAVTGLMLKYRENGKQSKRWKIWSEHTPIFHLLLQLITLEITYPGYVFMPMHLFFLHIVFKYFVNFSDAIY